MPYTLKSNRAKFKDANGNYKEFDLISENSTASQIAAIEAKGAQTLASIPADYTALSDSVGDLKSALNLMTEKKNLFKMTEGIFKGVTLKYLNDGGLSIVGTATETGNIVADMETSVSGYYALSVKSKNQSFQEGTTFIRLRNASWALVAQINLTGTEGQISTSTPSSNSINKIDITVTSGISYNTVLYIQFEKGATVTDFVSPFSAIDAMSRNEFSNLRCTTDESERLSLLNILTRQYFDPSKAIHGKYYARGKNIYVDNNDCYIMTPIRVYAGIKYSFYHVYGYFCTIIYDDGTVESLSDLTNTNINKEYSQLLKDGFAYITVYSSQINNAMVLAGANDKNVPYFIGVKAKTESIELANLIYQNQQNTISSTETIHPWSGQNYTIDGNAIVYTAPTTGNSGFYIEPTKREIIRDISIAYYVRNGHGSMMVYLWDKVTSNFADHIYAIGSFSETGSADLDLETISELKPAIDMSNWVFLFSNVGNDVSFTFDKIAIYNGSALATGVDGKTAGQFANEIKEVVDTIPKIIECGAGKSYTRLRDAIEAAEAVTGSTVVVYPGEYDLTDEFAAEIAAATGSTGICLKNDVHVRFLSGSYVKALFPQSSEWISNNFQPFYSDGSGFELDGANIEASNCRYCVHDERGGADVKYKNIYKNCKMKFTMDNPASSGGTSHYMQCIGGGLGKYGYIEIDGGYYETVNNVYSGQHSEQPISYHNGYSAGCDSKIFIKDVYLAHEGIIRLGCYGSSTIKSKVYVCGCSMYNPVYKMIEAPSQYNVDNFDVIEWNNEIRNQ